MSLLRYRLFSVSNTAVKVFLQVGTWAIIIIMCNQYDRVRTNYVPVCHCYIDLSDRTDKSINRYLDKKVKIMLVNKKLPVLN